MFLERPVKVPVVTTVEDVTVGNQNLSICYGYVDSVGGRVEDRLHVKSFVRTLLRNRGKSLLL